MGIEQRVVFSLNLYENKKKMFHFFFFEGGGGGLSLSSHDDYVQTSTKYNLKFHFFTVENPEPISIHTSVRVSEIVL